MHKIVLSLLVAIVKRLGLISRWGTRWILLTITSIRSSILVKSNSACFCATFSGWGNKKLQTDRFALKCPERGRGWGSQLYQPFVNLPPPYIIKSSNYTNPFWLVWKQNTGFVNHYLPYVIKSSNYTNPLWLVWKQNTRFVNHPLPYVIKSFKQVPAGLNSEHLDVMFRV